MRAPMTRSRTALVVVLALAGTAAMQTPAQADEPLPQRTTGVVVKNGQLLISVGLQDLFGQAERQHLTSGFSTRILIRVALQDAMREDGEPLALAVQRAEIVYDIWDEKFSVRVTRGLGAELRALAATADEAIWRATALWQFPIADTSRLRAGGRYVVLVRGDLESDLGGPDGGRPPLAGAAGARAAAAGRGRQLLRIVRQHLRQPAHRRQRAAGAFRVAAVRAAGPVAAAAAPVPPARATGSAGGPAKTKAKP